MSPPIAFIPAIELLGGKVVRLDGSDRAAATVYSDDPVKTTQVWRYESAGLLHVLDLDAAFDGPGARQREALRKIVEAARNVPVQLSGGLRDAAAIDEAFGLGISRVVLGAAAFEDPELVKYALAKYGVQRVAAATEDPDAAVARGAAVRGADVIPRAVQVVASGVKILLDAPTRREGTVERADLAELRALADAVAPGGAYVLCAGGIASLDDLTELRRAAIPNVVGAISGRAIYERSFSLPQARRVLEGPMK